MSFSHPWIQREPKQWSVVMGTWVCRSVVLIKTPWWIGGEAQPNDIGSSRYSTHGGTDQLVDHRAS